MRYLRSCLLMLVFIPCSLVGQVEVTFNPQWEQNTGSDRGQSVIIDKNDRPYFYFANKEGGLRIYRNIEGVDPIEILQLPVDTFSGLHVMNLEQRDTLLFIALGDFFRTESQPGLAVLNISNPESPNIEDIWISDNLLHGANYVRVHKNAAFLGGMDHGLIIFDISNSRDIDSVGRFLPDIHFPVENPTGTIVPNTRGFQIVGDTMYLCFDAGGLRIIDIQNPFDPVEKYQYINPLHDFTPQAYNDLVIQGDYGYIALDYCGFEIVHLKDLSNIQQVAGINPWECEDGGWLFNEGHTNQIQLDQERQLLYLSAGESELLCYDVSNLEEPELVGQVGVMPDFFGSWGCTLHNDQIYVSYITTVVPFISTYSGLRRFEITIDSTTSAIEEVLPDTEIVISPNPTACNIDLQSERATILQGYTLYDLSSRLIHRSVSDSRFSRTHRITLPENLHPGIFIIVLSLDRGQLTRKIVVNHH